MALRWGLAGAGLICHDFATAVGTLPSADHKLVAVAARNLDRAQRFAALHKISNAYEGYESLALDKNVDIVYVGVLNPQHYAVSKLMLEHGKHVLCEKPLCMNYIEAKALLDFAKLQNVFFMEAIWSRCFPAYEALDNHIQSGGLGEVLQVNVQFGVVISEVDRVAMKDLGGGTVLDLGVYCLQFAQLVFKEEPLKIVCAGHLNPEGVDISMSCVMTYSNGRTATLTTHSRVELSNEATIIGTKGKISLPTFWCPTILKASAAEITEWQLPQGAHRFNFHNSAGLSYEAKECRRCIKAGLKESPKVSHAESLTLARLEDTLRQQLGVVYPQD